MHVTFKYVREYNSFNFFLYFSIQNNLNAFASNPNKLGNSPGIHPLNLLEPYLNLKIFFLVTFCKL